MRKRNRRRKEQIEKQPDKASRIKNIIFDLIFYEVLIVMVVVSLAVSGKNATGPRVIAGFSAFTVLTGSMEREIPKGSLVITRKMDPADLKIGDDITYMVSESVSVTHRIIDIEENYQGTGERAFRTQGVMNKDPDTNPVAAVNVVGKVIFHNKMLGTAVNFAQANWPLLVFFLCVFLIFVKSMEYILKKDDDEEVNKSSEALEEKPKAEIQIIEDEDGFVLEIIEL